MEPRPTSDALILPCRIPSDVWGEDDRHDDDAQQYCARELKGHKELDER
jgi:hypothetical protein